MNLNESPQVAQANLDNLHKQLAMHRAQESRADLLLKLGFVLTFLLYLAFNMHLYLGDALSWKHYFNDWQAITGFVFMSTIVVLMALFLAWVKHHAYLHFGLYGSITLIVVTVIGFALFAEFFSSSANQDAKSNIQLAGNAAYQQSVTFNPASAITVSGASADVANASQRLARCEENLKRGKERHCEGDKAKLAALQASQTATMQAQAQMATAAMQANYDRQDKLKADSYNPAIVAVAKVLAFFFGGTYADHIKFAVVLITLFVAICFEILHHFLSHAKERAQNAVMALELEVAKHTATLASGNATAPATPKPTPAPNDGQYQDNKDGFGFIPSRTATPAMAQHQTQQDTTGTAYSTVTPPLFKYQQHPQASAQDAKKQPFGFIPNRSNNPAPSARLTAEPATTAPTGTTYRQAIRSNFTGYQDTPLDAPAKPYAQGLQDDAQNPMHRVSGEPEQVQPPQGIDSLYPAWVAAIRAKQCRPSAEASRAWIQKRIAPTMTGSKTNDLKRIAAMQKAFFARAVREGLITINPKYTNGGKKYIWKG
jgi:hypothetical protein